MLRGAEAAQPSAQPPSAPPTSLCSSSLQQQLHTFSHDEKFPQRQQRPRSRKELTGAGRRLSAAGGSSTSLLSAPAHCHNLRDPPTTNNPHHAHAHVHAHR